MTVLEAYAHHGSASYGEITPARLRDILFGDAPSDGEHARIAQALLETPATGLHRDPAVELAAELGLTLDQLEARCVELTGERLGSSCLGPVAQLIEVGLVARYGNDLEGLNLARQAVRQELIAKGWALPPYTNETD